MKTIVSTISFGLLLLVLSVHGQEAPAIQKSTFGPEALKQPLYDQSGAQKTAGDILEANKGKTIVLYIWATWCPDCVKGFPAFHQLQAANPDVHFLYFSLDREEARWKEGIQKYELPGEHYWFKTAWKNDFNNYIDLNWIPRYLVIAPDGSIARYYAVKADDPEIQAAIDEVKSKK